MSRRIVTMAITAVLAATLAVPAPPAAAHSRIPKGKYPCWHMSGTTTEYSYYDLHITGRNTYKYMIGSKRLGKAGKFRHGKRDRLVFKSGYLAKQGYKATHVREGGRRIVKMFVRVNGVRIWEYCSGPS